MSTAEIIAAALSLPGVAKGSTITVEATDPAKFPNLSKTQSHAVFIVGPRGRCGLSSVRHDGSLTSPTFC